jgi:hypothetical protein
VLLQGSDLSGTWDLPSTLDQTAKYPVALQATFSYVDQQGHKGSGQLLGKALVFYSMSTSQWKTYIISIRCSPIYPGEITSVPEQCAYR